jgi:hypothetical protein
MGQWFFLCLCSEHLLFFSQHQSFSTVLISFVFILMIILLSLTKASLWELLIKDKLVI